MAKTLIYLQENGLTDLDALDAALAEAHEKVKTSRAEIKAIEDELNKKKDLQRQVLNAHAGKDLHAEYLSASSRFAWKDAARPKSPTCSRKKRC